MKKNIKQHLQHYPLIYAVLKKLNVLKKLLLEKAIYVLSIIFHLLPIDKNKIVVKSFYGRGYGSNAKYIIEELVLLNPKVYVIWLCKSKYNESNTTTKNITFLNSNKLREIYELMTAKIWIDDCRKIEIIKKRKKQFYLQTWHSPLRLKKIEKDALDSLSPQYIKLAQHDSKNISMMISGSKFSHNIYQNSFWYNGEIQPFGTPRCDIFFKDLPQITDRVKTYFSIPHHCKVVLYAPTFRNDANKNSYFLDFESLIKTFNAKENYFLLIRLHPNVAKQSEHLIFNNNILNATFYDDMQELLYTADALITDYSSSMFDMSIAQKPCFLFTPDLGEYLSKERQLYFDLDKLPFPCSSTFDELVKAINYFDEEKYLQKNRDFLKRIGNYECGDASIKTAQMLYEKMKE